MLFTLSIGATGNRAQKDIDWKYISDKYGNHFIENSAIRQRIKVDDSVVNPDGFPMNLIAMDTGNPNLSGIKIPSELKATINNRNMNLVFKRKYRNEENKNFHLLYIKLNDLYTLKSYSSDYDIIKTFHSEPRRERTKFGFKDVKAPIYDGCAISFYEDTNSPNTLPICLLTAVVERNNAIDGIESTYEMRVIYDPVKGIVTYNIEKYYHRIDDHTADIKSEHFVIGLNNSKPVTAGFVVVPDWYQFVEEQTAKIKNRRIVVFDANVTHEKYKDDLPSVLKSNFSGVPDIPKMTAITFVGFTPQQSDLSIGKIHTAFVYNFEESKYECIRSL